MSLPLEGIRVLDFSNLIPGPFCTLILADLGAEVIKVERPSVGDPIRRSEKMFHSINRNKKSITIDLKNKEDIDSIKNYIKTCDIIVEGFRPGVMERVGLDYQVVSEINSQIIYCSISGFGQTGPLAKLPGHDVNYLALSGALSISGDPKGPPAARGGVQVADLSSAMYAVISIFAALRNRDKNSKGEYIDVSITDSVLAWMSPRIGSYYDQMKPLKENFLATGAYGAFEAKDGQYIAIGSIEDHFFENLCIAINHQKLLKDERYKSWPLRSANANSLNPIIEKEIRTKTSDEWMMIFGQYDLPCSKVNGIEDLTTVESFKKRGLIEHYGPEEGEYFVKYPVGFLNLKTAKPQKAVELGEANSEFHESTVRKVE